jgi:uncharacterized protein
MKMSLEILLLVIVITVLVYLCFYFAGTLLAPVSKQNSQNQVCFGSRCFFVELAKTSLEQEKGLMNRKQLDKDKGMLFIFEKEGIYAFWMKNTLIPLDIVWINSNNKVVFISQNTEPCKSLICPSVVPTAKAKYILEINAGICEEIGLKLGDELKINIK